MTLRLLVDHRDDLVDERKRVQLRLRWHCHDLEIDLVIPPRALDRYVWLDRLRVTLGALPQSTRRRIALLQLVRCRELTVQIGGLARDIRPRVGDLAPDPLPTTPPYRTGAAAGTVCPSLPGNPMGSSR